MVHQAFGVNNLRDYHIANQNRKIRQSREIDIGHVRHSAGVHAETRGLYSLAPDEALGRNCPAQFMGAAGVCKTPGPVLRMDAQKPWANPLAPREWRILVHQEMLSLLPALHLPLCVFLHEGLHMGKGMHLTAGHRCRRRDRRAWLLPSRAQLYRRCCVNACSSNSILASLIRRLACVTIVQ